MGVVGTRSAGPVAGDRSRGALGTGDEVRGCWGFLG